MHVDGILLHEDSVAGEASQAEDDLFRMSKSDEDGKSLKFKLSSDDVITMTL